MSGEAVRRKRSSLDALENVDLNDLVDRVDPEAAPTATEGEARRRAGPSTSAGNPFRRVLRRARRRQGTLPRSIGPTVVDGLKQRIEDLHDRLALLEAPGRTPRKEATAPAPSELLGELALLRERPRGYEDVRATTQQYRWFAVVTLCSAAGIALCEVGDALSRSTRSTSQLPFWAGLMLILVPVVLRLLSPEAARGERISLVLLVGLSLYLVKVIWGPFGLVMTDELAHASNTAAILRTHGLFHANSILPVTAYYPGLESVVAAVASMTGLTSFGAGLIVIGAARIVIMLALYLLFERLSGSSRIAALGAVIYTANSSFLFFDAQVSYESLALPLLVWILFAVTEWRQGDDRRSWSVVILVGTVAVVATHHVTSYGLLVLLLALCLVQHALSKRREAHPSGHAHRGSGGLSEERKALVERYMNDSEMAKSRAPDTVEERRRLPLAEPTRPAAAQEREVPHRPAGQAPWVFLAFGVAATIGWLTFVASYTVQYLTPVFTKALISTFHTAAAEGGASRKLFTSFQGYQAPLLERAVGIGSWALMAVALPFGLRVIRRRYRHDPYAVVLAVVSVAFFGVAVLRFAPGAWETAKRASEFLFIGLAFVLALTDLDRWSPPRTPWLGRTLTAACIGVIFAGGVISGWPPTLRLSQPYRIEAGSHAIEPEGRQMARWARANLAVGARYAAADDDARLLATYGDGYAASNREWDVERIVRVPDLLPWQLQNLARGRLRYVVVDRSLDSFGELGFFFARRPRRPDELLPAGAARKFDRYGADRLYDSGTIKVYDLTGARRAPRKP